MHRPLIAVIFTALISSAVLAGCDAGADGAPDMAGMPTQDNGIPARNVLDGGERYYDKFVNAPFRSNTTDFPIGVWFESVKLPEDVVKDRQAGINLYVALTADSDLDVVQSGGMHAFLQADEWGTSPAAQASPAVAGWLLSDEIDMTEGHPDGIETLKSIREGLPADGRLQYNNYGKGVMFRMDRKDASDFVNSQDVVSADAYWFTDSNLCGSSEGGRWITGLDQELSVQECRLAANYGRTVRYLRSLINPPGSKPVWAFIEVGHPAKEADWPTIRPAEVRAAVWSSIINGARGVVYFNHSFGGPAQTQHALREPAYAQTRAMVTSVNRQISEMSGILNSASITGITSHTGRVDVMVKFGKSYSYIFAGSTVATSQTVGIAMPCAGDGSADVVGENRSIAFSDGRLSDTFEDGNAVHIYRLPLTTQCRNMLSAR